MTGNDAVADDVRHAAEALAAIEAHRAGIHVEPDPALVAAGWQLRFVTDALRAQEWLATYHDLGFETLAEPIAAAQVSPACGDCRLVALFRYLAIYTRRAPAPALRQHGSGP